MLFRIICGRKSLDNCLRTAEGGSSHGTANVPVAIFFFVRFEKTWLLALKCANNVHCSHSLLKSCNIMIQKRQKPNFGHWIIDKCKHLSASLQLIPTWSYTSQMMHDKSFVFTATHSELSYYQIIIVVSLTGRSIFAEVSLLQSKYYLEIDMTFRRSFERSCRYLL